ncbi:MAG: hypothetical protein ACYDFR_03705 [Candidatus Omnitrophota bacterium]
MEFSRNRIIKIAVMLVFLFCMLYSNFFAVRMMLHYGVDTYFYDKLLVAYTVGGAKGLKMELEKIPFTDKLPRESIMAKDFTVRFETLSDPEVFLRDKVEKSKKMVNLIRGLRSVAIVFMAIIFAWQLVINFSGRLKSKK